MNQKSLTWDDIVKQPDGTFSRKKPDPTEKKAGKNKYKNKKVTLDGITFDSKLEKYMYGLLNFHKIPFQLKPKWEIQAAFTYDGQAVRSIRMEPDFVISTTPGFDLAVVDTKGMITKEWKIKVKLLKNNFKKQGTQIPIFTPTSETECQKTIIQLKALLNK